MDSPVLEKENHADVDVRSNTGSSVIDRVIEKRVLRKFDLHIFPLIIFMYFCSSMDLSNLGNAKSDGLDADLHLKGDQYNILLSMMYLPLTLFGPPMVMLVKKVGAGWILPGAILGFGTFQMLGAVTSNFAGIMTTRWFLMSFESGFYPATIYYMTLFYKRSELAGRLGSFFASSSIASAFTGLIAYGCFQIKGDLYGWQYLFLVEGAISCLAGCLSIFFLPHSAAKAHFLTSEEMHVAVQRVERDSSCKAESKFVLREALKGLFEDKFFLGYCMVGISNGVPLFSVSTFLVQIVERLGYGAIDTQLLVVAPNVFGAISLICFARSSDHFRNRAFHIIGGLGLTMIGFIVLATIDVIEHRGVAYFACFLLTAGCSVPSPLLATWYSNNSPDEGKRATKTAFIEAIANLSGLISSNIFMPQTAPNYIPALGISAGFGGFAICLVATMHLLQRHNNHRRDKEQGVRLTACDVPMSELQHGYKSDKFRYFY